jgi:rhodanese-related sulfurtransferase/rubrerythrin
MPEHAENGTDGPVTRSAEEVRRFLADRAMDAVNLVDVRQDWEYREFHLPGARLLPLGELPDRLSDLDRGKPTVTYCRTGRRSAAAASILAGEGFSPVVNMAGGVMAWRGAGATGDEDQGLFLLPRNVRLETVFQTAYIMEASLGAFYLAQAEASGNPEAAETFRALAGFEDRHKAMVLALWRKSGAPVPDAAGRDAAPSGAVPDGALEGGLSGEAYLGLRGGRPEDLREVLELAMAVEAQALDLYARSARAVGSDETRQALTRLAREEKGHLAALSVLMDRQSPQTAS